MTILRCIRNYNINNIRVNIFLVCNKSLKKFILIQSYCTHPQVVDNVLVPQDRCTGPKRCKHKQTRELRPFI